MIFGTLFSDRYSKGVSYIQGRYIQVRLYNLASYLVRTLQPISPNHFTVKDSLSFAEWAKSYNHNNEFMCSFDVRSLFTNFPLDETIQIYLDK